MSTAAPAQLEGVEHKYADLPDFRLHYAEAGEPSGDPSSCSTAGPSTGTSGTR